MRQRIKLLSLAVSLIFSILSVKPSHSQDSLPSPFSPSYLDTSSVVPNIIVDGTLSQDMPTANPPEYRTLQAAYAAAPAGTAASPTVIGIKPNLYNLDTTTPYTPGLTISKSYITLLGLTNNQRNVVLYGDQGNEEGAGNSTQTYDGYVISVSATGFTARNLTIGNFCNVNYEYPGGPGVPAQTVPERSSTVTQAVAIQTSGDKHVFDHVSLLSKLDTTFIGSTRGYFTNVYIEGTNDFIGGGTISVWQNSYTYYPTGNGEGTVSGTVYIDSTFQYADIPGGGSMEFYKGPTSGGAYPEGSTLPAVLIHCTLPVQVKTANSASVAWVIGYAPVNQNIYSLTYQNVDTNGNPANIADASQGPPAYTLSRELSATEAEAFNVWNLLSATPTGTQDGWDPAGVGNTYINLGEGSLPFGMSISNGNPTIITPGSIAGTTGTISATVFPARAASSYPITWTSSGGLVSLNPTTGASTTVTGTNNTGVSQHVPVNATLSNGFYESGRPFVEPPYIAPPTFTANPTLGAPVNGTVTVNYTLNLAPNRTDNSIITWYACSDSAGDNPRKVGISESYTAPPVDNVPLRIYTLQLGDVGSYLEATVTPQADISNPGSAMSVISATAITLANIGPTTESPNYPLSPNFGNFPVTAETAYVPGYWTVSGTWTNEAPPTGSTFVNGWGIRVASQGAAIYYVNPGPTQDMEETVVMTPEKTAGQGFGSPGSAADSTPGNIVQNADIYIKYDPSTGNGYSVRWWRTTASSTETMWQLYQHVAGVGSPVPSSTPAVLTGVFFPNTTINLSIIGNVFTVTASNNQNSNTLFLQGTVAPNPYGGAGTRWSGTVPSGNSVAYSYFQILYPGPLTITANNVTMPVGGPLPTLTASYSGFVNGDTPASLDGSPSLTTTATASSPAGTYPIIAALGTIDDPNYVYTFVNGTLSVVAAPAVTLTTTSTISGTHSGGYTATITVKNTGATPATNVVLNTVTLGAVSGTPLPQSWGTIGAGGTATFTVDFPGSTGLDGAGVAEKISGTYTSGTFSSSIRSVTLP
jgi:hypothetical protein